MFGICFWHESTEITTRYLKKKKVRRWWIDCELWYEPARGKPTHTRNLFFFFPRPVIDVYSTWKSHRADCILPPFYFLFLGNVLRIRKTCADYLIATHHRQQPTGASLPGGKLGIPFANRSLETDRECRAWIDAGPIVLGLLFFWQQKGDKWIPREMRRRVYLLVDTQTTRECTVSNRRKTVAREI